MKNEKTGVRSQNLEERKDLKYRRDAESAKKTILDINELSKRILGTAIEVLIVRREATVVFLPFKPLAYFASLR